MSRKHVQFQPKLSVQTFHLAHNQRSVGQPAFSIIFPSNSELIGCFLQPPDEAALPVVIKKAYLKELSPNNPKEPLHSANVDQC